MRVSIVIPALNAASFISDAIDSCLAQTAGTFAFDLEILVVDNGSTDGTADLVRRRYGAKVVLLAEPEPGIAHARNTGIAQVTGDTLALLDADDLWLPGKLALQTAVLAERPEVDLVFCHGVEFADPPGLAPCRMEPRPFLSSSALCARRSAMDKAGPFPPFRSGEFIAWYGLATARRLTTHVVPETLVRRRVHATNSTRNRALLADYPAAMRWLIERRRELGLETEPSR